MGIWRIVRRLLRSRRLFRSWLEDIRTSPLFARLCIRKIKKNAYEITGISPFPLDTRIKAKKKPLPVNKITDRGGDRP